MKTAPLGEIAEVVSGATPKTGDEQLWGGDILWATPADLSQLDGPYISSTPRAITEAGLKSCAAKILPAGSVLLSSRAPIGHVAINTVPMATNQGFKSLIPRLDVVDAKYLYHWLRANTAYLQSLGNGATFKEISKSVVSKVEVPLPPLDDQRRIASILDQADTLRVRRRRVLSELDVVAESIFHSMFGSFAGKFLTVEEVAAPAKGSIRTGPFGSQLLHGEFVDEGIAVLGLDNVVGNRFSWKERRFITPEKYEQLRRYTVHPGDVLISIMGTCGRCVVVPTDVGTAINTKHICAITLNREIVLPEFVRAAFLWHPRARQHLTQRTKGSIMDGLNMGIVKEMPLPVPQLDDQHKFVATLAQVDTLTETALESSADLDDLFASFQDRAFSGDL